MDLMIELSADQERELAEIARQEGVEEAEVARKLVGEALEARDLPETPEARVTRLLSQWQAEDGTPLETPPATRPGETPTRALFRQWAEEDANMSDEERQVEDRKWRDVASSLL